MLIALPVHPEFVEYAGKPWEKLLGGDERRQPEHHRQRSPTLWLRQGQELSPQVGAYRGWEVRTLYA